MHKDHTRDAVVKDVQSGRQSARDASKHYKVPLGTVYTWMAKAKKHDRLEKKLQASLEKPHKLLINGQCRKLPQVVDAVALLRFLRDEVVASGRNPTKRELAAMSALAELESL